MLDISDYKGNKVIIYDETRSKTIAETTVLDFNMSLQTIVVDSSRFNSAGVDRVSVLILGDKAVYEYRGTTRSTGSKYTLGIALYSGKAKEDRKYTRYDVYAPAHLEYVMSEGKPVLPEGESEMQVVNISSEGILIRGRAGLMDIGTCFGLRLTVATEDLFLDAEVVRRSEISADAAEYGCKLKAQAKEKPQSPENETESEE